MLVYLSKRMIASLTSLCGLSVLVLLLLKLVPGTIVDQLLGAEAAYDPEAQRALRAFFGLDDPFWVQYGRWAGELLHGRLGESWRTGMPVADLLRARLGVTVELVTLSLFLATLLGVPSGIFLASRRGQRGEELLRIIGTMGLSVPVFWLGTLLMVVLSVWLRWVPPVVYVGFQEDPLQHAKIMALPVISLALPQGVILMRTTRSVVLEVLRQDYVRTARSKGLSERVILYKHVLRNSMIAIITVIGVLFVQLVGGVIAVEEVFSLPGVGRLVVQAILERDYPVVLGCTFIIGVISTLVNVAIDLIYALIDPRVSYR